MAVDANNPEEFLEIISSTLESDKDKMMKFISFIDKVVNELNAKQSNNNTRHPLVFVVIRHDPSQYSYPFTHAVYAKELHYNTNTTKLFQSIFLKSTAL